MLNLFAKTRACVSQVKLDSGGNGAQPPSLYLFEPAPKSLCVKRLPCPMIITHPSLPKKKPSDTEASLREKLNRIQEKLEFMVLIAGYQLVANRTTRHYWAMVLPLVISLCIHSGEYMLKRTKKILI